MTDDLSGIIMMVMRFLAPVLVILTFLGWVYFLVSTPKLGSYQNRLWLNEAGDNVVVLFWTSYFGIRNGNPYTVLGIPKESFPDECFRNCEITFDRERIKEAHAIVFHERDLKKSDMPTLRAATQIWVFLGQESPIVAVKNLKAFSGVFNWTMTYRRDSDVFHPYRMIVPKNELDENSTLSYDNFTKFLTGKKKLVAGVISNCFTASKRETLIEQLKNEGLSVDIFGRCGTFICPRGGYSQNGSCSESEFWAQLAKDYKFYVAFENALCWDYVTEKFFRTLELGLVPVVYGGAAYKEIAPPNSFIDSENFQSLKELVNFLKNLDKKPEYYKMYFEWRKRYKVMNGDGWCKLCQKVRKHSLERKFGQHHVPKIYEKLKDWWFEYPCQTETKRACRKPKKFE